MRQTGTPKKFYLEPLLTPFQVAILMDMVKGRAVEIRKDLTQDSPDMASAAASLVEFDEMLKALKEEHDLWDDFRSRVRPKKS